MKYSDDGTSLKSEPIFKQHNPNKVPLNKCVWAFAYYINNETMYKYLFCKPESGEVVLLTDGRLKNFKKIPSYVNKLFIPYKKGTNEFKKSGIINANLRYYADTYEEAVEGYNSLIQEKIIQLNKKINELKKDII